MHINFFIKDKQVSVGWGFFPSIVYLSTVRVRLNNRCFQDFRTLPGSDPNQENSISADSECQGPVRISTGVGGGMRCGLL